MFFTNCPLVSKLFLITLRRNLKRKTQSKVYISLGPLTSVRLDWYIRLETRAHNSHLQGQLPLSALPPGFGGSNLAAENLICMGGPVPRPFRRHQHNVNGEDYISSSSILVNPSYFYSEYKDMMYMEVEAGALLSMKYTISTEGVMTWRYKIDTGDISFGIKRKKASQNSTSKYGIDIILLM